jgi:hypothetical protein
MINDYGPMDSARWGRVDAISVNGFLTGIGGGDNCADGFQNLTAAQTALLVGFGRDFQDLVITDTHGGSTDILYSGQNCTVKNVSFEESRYVGLLGYSIELEGYDPDYWTSESAYGVLEPEDTYDFNQDPEDEVVTITHTVSAKGFNIDNSTNALDNAITFVQGRTGYKFEGYVGFPKFIEAGTCGSAGEGTGGNPDVDDCCFIPILQTQSETTNRIEGTYSVTETYEADPSGCSGIVLRYTTSLESGIDQDFATATISAEAKHSKTGDWEELRTYFKNLDFYDLLVSDIEYDGLNQVPITLGVEEYETGRMITFDATYDNNQLFGANNSYYDYSVSLSTDEVLDITSATVQGTIVSRGNLTERMTRTSAYLDTVYPNNSPSYLRSRAQEVYGEIKGDSNGETPYSLRIVPSSVSIISGDKGEIQVNATFDDAYTLEDDDQMRNSSYSYQVRAALPVYKPKASVNENGLYVIFDTKVVNRENFSISSQLMGKHTADSASASMAYSPYLEGKANALVTVLRAHLGADGEKLRLENESVNRNDVDGLISSNYSYSQDKDSFLSDQQAKIEKAETT